MSPSRPVSRRTALASLGASSLGFAVASQIASSATRSVTEIGQQHPLVGHWLSFMGLPSDSDTIVVAPTFFGADGSVVIVFPCTELMEDRVQMKGAAIGTWAPIDDRTAHVTAVQVLSDIDGTYAGSITFDAYPSVDDDGQSYTVDSAFDLRTMRDGLNEIVQSLQGPFSNPLRGRRMQPGNPGFPTAAPTVPGATEPSDQDARLGDPQ